MRDRQPLDPPIITRDRQPIITRRVLRPQHRRPRTPQRDRRPHRPRRRRHQTRLERILTVRHHDHITRTSPPQRRPNLLGGVDVDRLGGARGRGAIADVGRGDSRVSGGTSDGAAVGFGSAEAVKAAYERRSTPSTTDRTLSWCLPGATRTSNAAAPGRLPDVDAVDDAAWPRTRP